MKFSFPFFNKCVKKGSNNELRFLYTDVKWCTFSITGDNNRFRCQSLFKKSQVMIEGNGNEVVIKKDGELRNLRIWIKGNNCRIVIGESVIFNGGRIVCAGVDNHVNIGDDCMFAEGIEIWASDTHPIYQKGEVINKSRSIVIGRHVWLGTNTSVSKGSTIGEGSVIGMCSFVRGSIPDHVIAAGNPIRVIKSDIEWEKTEINC